MAGVSGILVVFHDGILLVRPSSLRFALLSSSRKDDSFLCIIWELFEEKGLVVSYLCAGRFGGEISSTS